MKELMKRKNGPAIRDTFIWFGSLAVLGYIAYQTWGHMVGVSRLPGIWHPLCDNGRFQVA